MSEAVLVGIDQGTSGTRTVAFDERLRPLAEAYRPATVRHPQPGWIEKDAEETLATVTETLDEVTASAGGAGAIAGIGLDNEGETVVAWDAGTGRPLAPAVVWGCRRSAGIVERLAEAGVGPRIEELSGLPLDPYFSSTKIRWLVEEVAEVRDAARAGGLRVTTLDGFLTARLAGRALTDPSTAARTQLQELGLPGRWSEELLALHDVDPAWLPEIVPSAGGFGELPACGGSASLRGLLVDQTASLAGHGCVAAGLAKATYGTGIFAFQTAGSEVPSAPGLLPVVAWTLAGETTYALDGGIFSAGTVVQWLRDGAGLIESPAETESLARSVPDTGGVRFLPALAGLGAPWWRSQARAVFAGITSATTRAHLVRAALDAFCFRVRDVVDAMPARPDVLRIDGGLTANGYLVGRQADVLGIPVEVARMPETTALGAAAMAGVGAGVLELRDLPALTGGGRIVEPSGTDAAEEEYAAWRAFADAASQL